MRATISACRSLSSFASRSMRSICSCMLANVRSAFCHLRTAVFSDSSIVSSSVCHVACSLSKSANCCSSHSVRAASCDNFSSSCCVDCKVAWRVVTCASDSDTAELSVSSWSSRFRFSSITVAFFFSNACFSASNISIWAVIDLRSRSESAM